MVSWYGLMLIPFLTPYTQPAGDDLPSEALLEFMAEWALTEQEWQLIEQLESPITEPDEMEDDNETR